MTRCVLSFIPPFTVRCPHLQGENITSSGLAVPKIYKIQIGRGEPHGNVKWCGPFGKKIWRFVKLAPRGARQRSYPILGDLSLGSSLPGLDPQGLAFAIHAQVFLTVGTISPLNYPTGTHRGVLTVSGPVAVHWEFIRSPDRVGPNRTRPGLLGATFFPSGPRLRVQPPVPKARVSVVTARCPSLGPLGFQTQRFLEGDCPDTTAGATGKGGAAQGACGGRWR